MRKPLLGRLLFSIFRSLNNQSNQNQSYEKIHLQAQSALDLLDRICINRSQHG